MFKIHHSGILGKVIKALEICPILISNSSNGFTNFQFFESTIFSRNWVLTCSWHQKNETTNSPILKFTNLKCCKMSFKSFKIKKQDINFFLKEIKNHTLLKRGFKRLVGLFAVLTIRELVNLWIRGFIFLMSRTVGQNNFGNKTPFLSKLSEFVWFLFSGPPILFFANFIKHQTGYTPPVQKGSTQDPKTGK